MVHIIRSVKVPSKLQPSSMPINLLAYYKQLRFFLSARPTSALGTHHVFLPDTSDSIPQNKQCFWKSNATVDHKLGFLLSSVLFSRFAKLIYFILMQVFLKFWCNRCPTLVTIWSCLCLPGALALWLPLSLSTIISIFLNRNKYLQLTKWRQQNDHLLKYNKIGLSSNKVKL